MNIFSKAVLIGTLVSLGACQQAGAPAPEANLMIMLTKASDGANDASFIEVSGDENCAQRVKAARAVFPAANIEYVAHYCVYSPFRFEAFAHGSAPTGPTHSYQINLSGSGKRLLSVKEIDSVQKCRADKKTMCVSSAQGKIP